MKMTHFRKRALLMLLMLGAALQAQAAEWVWVGSNEGKSYYISNEVTTATDQNYTYLVWVKVTYDYPEVRAFEKRDNELRETPYEEVDLMVFSYDWAYYALSSTALYGRDGSLLLSLRADYELELEYVPRESIAETIADQARAYYKGNDNRYYYDNGNYNYNEHYNYNNGSSNSNNNYNYNYNNNNYNYNGTHNYNHGRWHPF